MRILTEMPVALILVLQINVHPTGMPNLPLVVHQINVNDFKICSNPCPCGKDFKVTGNWRAFIENTVSLARPQGEVSHEFILSMNIIHTSAFSSWDIWVPRVRQSPPFFQCFKGLSVLESVWVYIHPYSWFPDRILWLLTVNRKFGAETNQTRYNSPL